MKYPSIRSWKGVLQPGDTHDRCACSQDTQTGSLSTYTPLHYHFDPQMSAKPALYSKHEPQMDQVQIHISKV